MKDQVLVLEAIGEVRSELREDMTQAEAWDAMTRLVTLYSLLNVGELKQAVEERLETEHREAA